MDCFKVTVTGGTATQPVPIQTQDMRGGWAPRAFHCSWDGKATIVYRFDGFRVVKGTDAKDYKTRFLWKNVFWSPDNKNFAYWAPAGVTVCNVDNLGAPGGPPQGKVIYKWDKETRHPFGLTWSPSGSDIYVIENWEQGSQSGGAIQKVPSSGGSPVEILHLDIPISFCMPPDSWYEDGSGPKEKPFLIAYGTKDGLFVMDGTGGQKTKICDIPADLVRDVIWNPNGKEELLVRFIAAGKGSGTKPLEGLYLVHVDKRGTVKKGEEASLLEQISPDTNLHTIWFTHKGTYVCWANEEGVWYRETAKPKDTPVKVELPGGSKVKGCAFDDAEKRLAVAVSNKIYLWDVDKKKSTEIVKVGDNDKTFVAEPTWHGDEITFSSFTDTGAKRRLVEKACPPDEKK